MAGPKSTHLCECGCGQYTNIADRTRKDRGMIRGQPARFIEHHASRTAAAANRTHGLADSPTYDSWLGLVARCTNPKNPAWASYGGRGIRVCDKWLKFENFVADMGIRPSGTSIDRIDNDGNYEPTNCRWATRREQNGNQRTSVRLTLNGKTQHIAAWARETGLDHETISYRIRSGWSIEAALTKPARKFNWKSV